MSASQEKKKRQAMHAAGQDKENQPKKKSKLTLVIGIICAVVILVAAAFFAMLGGGFFQNHTTAATVGNYSLTPAMYNYFYQETYQSMMSQFGDLASYIIDSSKPLDQQMYDDENGITWADYLKEQTNSVIAQTYAVYSLAVSEGFELSEDQQTSVDATIMNMEYAALYANTTTDAYLTNIYGTGSNEDNYREFVEVKQLASAYSTAHADALEYTADEIAAYYEENKDTLDTVSYRYFLSSVYGDEVNEDGTQVIDAEASLAQAEEIAAGSQGDEAAFNDLAYEYASEASKSYYEDEDATLVTDQSVGGLPETIRDWLTDPARQYGDTTAIATDEGSCYAVLFVDNSSKNDISMIDVRHILIIPESSSDDESVAAAKAEAEEILAEYEAGDRTEESFAELAKEYSEDSSASNGGLYENVRPGQMVEAFENWCFDESRQPGDVGIVETTYGFHVMYFVGDGDSYREYLIAEDMRSEDTNEWITEQAQNVTVTLNDFGMRFTKLG